MPGTRVADMLFIANCDIAAQMIDNEISPIVTPHLTKYFANQPSQILMQGALRALCSPMSAVGVAHRTRKVRPCSIYKSQQDSKMSGSVSWKPQANK